VPPERPLAHPAIPAMARASATAFKAVMLFIPIVIRASPCDRAYRRKSHIRSVRTMLMTMQVVTGK